MYGLSVVKKIHVHTITVAEMRMITRICSPIVRDKIKNEVSRDKVGVASIEDMLREARLR